MKAELARRQSHVDQLRALFVAKPLVWIDAVELIAPGSQLSWRTRVSDLRRELKAEDRGTIENELVWDNGVIVGSRYRFVPFVRQGRDSTKPRGAGSRLLFHDLYCK